jgi:hypothetical protein
MKNGHRASGGHFFMGAYLPVAGQYFAASPGLLGSRVIALAVRMLCLNLQPSQ